MTTAATPGPELRGRWNYPTSIRFGAGRVSELPAACRELGSERPLLVTDAGLARLPIVGRAVALCRDAGLGCEVFSEVQPNPVEANVTQGVDRFRAGGHDGAEVRDPMVYKLGLMGVDQYGRFLWLLGSSPDR